MFLQSFSDPCSSPQRQVDHGRQTRPERFQIVKVLQQRRCGFRPYARHARDVVDRVTHQGQVVGELAWMDAKALAESGNIKLRVGGKIPPVIVASSKNLAQVLIPGDDSDRTIRRVRNCCQCGDVVVGLKGRTAEARQAKNLSQLPTAVQLKSQGLVRQLPAGIVVRIDVVAKTATQAFIEGRSHMSRRSHPFH